MEAFDPYHIWLAIPPEKQPPNHYDLLGIPLFESNDEVISFAADQRMGHLRNLAASTHSEQSQKLLNEVAAAKICLLNKQTKSAYDAGLQASRQATNVSSSQGSVPSASAAPRETPAAEPVTVMSQETDSSLTGTHWVRLYAFIGAMVVFTGLLGLVYLNGVQGDRANTKTNLTKTALSPVSPDVPEPPAVVPHATSKLIPVSETAEYKKVTCKVTGVELWEWSSATYLKVGLAVAGDGREILYRGWNGHETSATLHNVDTYRKHALVLEETAHGRRIEGRQLEPDNFDYGIVEDVVLFRLEGSLRDVWLRLPHSALGLGEGSFDFMITNQDVVPCRQLFDGQTLTGWEPTKEEVWSAGSGEIVGYLPTENYLDAIAYLLCDGQLPDRFELRLEFWIDNGEVGIVLSPFSNTQDPFGGSRIDLVAQTIKLASEQLASPSSSVLERQDGWNRCRIIADGQRITLKINNDNDVFLEIDPENWRPVSGKLALQVSGREARTRFRRLELRSLENEDGRSLASD